MFDLDALPPEVWELLRIEVVREALKKADEMPRCQDCLPATFLFPMVPPDPEMVGIWVVVHAHDESCPAYAQQGGESFEVL